MLTLLLNADVYAPAQLGLRHLLIGGGQVLAVHAGPAHDFSLPDVEIVDLAARPVIPGLVDGHAHLTGGGGESGFASRVPPVPVSHFTSAGITSVVGVLGTDDTTRDTQSLLAQARGLREAGLSAWCHTGGYHLPPVTLTGSVRGDIVNLDPVIGVGEVALSDHRSSQPTLDELLRLASEAHVAGLISGKAGILHLHLGDGERGLDLVRRALRESELPGRVFNPTHVNRRKALFTEALELTAAGSVVDLTAFPVGPDEDAWAAEVALVQYLESGCPAQRISVSSDGGGCLPIFNAAGELQSMDIGRPQSLFDCLRATLALGVDLATALPAFTSNPAQLLRLPGKGRLAPGAAADLIVLDEHNAIADVMAGGRWHVRDGQQIRFGQFETN